MLALVPALWSFFGPQLRFFSMVRVHFKRCHFHLSFGDMSPLRLHLVLHFLRFVSSLPPLTHINSPFSFHLKTTQLHVCKSPKAWHTTNSEFVRRNIARSSF